MRIVIKKESCIGCELCVNLCPAVFMQWGLHMRPVFEVPGPTDHLALIDKAIEECPAHAISIQKTGTKP